MQGRNHEMRESRLIRLDSRDRTTGTRYNCQFNLNDYLLHNTQRVLLKSAFIPNTAYNVSTFKNTLVYDAGAGIQTLTFTPGQYNLTELMALFVSEFAAATPSVTFGYTYNTNTSKLTFTSTPALLLYGDTSTISELIGLEPVPTAVIVSQTMANVVNLSGLQKVYIGSSVIAKGTSMTSSDKEHINIFTEIPITGAYGEIEHRVLNDLHSIDESTHAVPFNISSPDITLYDQDLNILDLNGANYQIVLKVFPE